MSKSWEVDPEMRSKLLAIQKTKGNDRCCDCGAPSPQWASPKFGTFICLNCAGIHRGLGVHISFVRSITMDAFKPVEIQRMEHGGNKPWKEFFDSHALTIAEGQTFEDSTVKERYEGEVGEEWKARITAKVEGREYVPGEHKPSNTTPRSNTPSISRVGTGGRPGDRLSRTGSPANPDILGSRKEKNEAFFAKKGEENASRPDSVPPSQGGKYSGFGGGMPPPPSNQEPAVPGIDDFQRDPVAALTKGFSWFTTTVGKGAKTVNESYIQPTAKTLAETDFAAQARLAATEVSRNLQSGARGATEQISRFVEGPSENNTTSRQRVEPERKDFWDEFASLGENRRTGGPPGAGGGPGLARSGSRPGAIGTATLKRDSSTSSSIAATTPAAGAATKVKPKGKDEWDDW